MIVAFVPQNLERNIFRGKNELQPFYKEKNATYGKILRMAKEGYVLGINVLKSFFKENWNA